MTFITRISSPVLPLYVFSVFRMGGTEVLIRYEASPQFQVGEISLENGPPHIDDDQFIPSDTIPTPDPSGQ